MRTRRNGENGTTQLPSLFSRISNRTPVLCLQLSSTPCFFTLRDQAPGSTSLLSFVSDVAVFPVSLLPKDCGFDPLCPSVGGLTKQWPNEQWPNVGCTQVHPWDPGVSCAPRLRSGASPSQKMFARLCSSSISGINGKSQHTSGTRIHP